MPNWCFSDITIISNDQTKIKKLYDSICEWTETNFIENDFGPSWLGNIVARSEICAIDDVPCRGTLTEINLYNGIINIRTETAWEPMLKMWSMLIDKYLPNGNIIYTAEECGNGLYCTNDPSLIGKYYIDSIDIDEVESRYDATEDDVIKTLQSLLNSESKNINDLLNELRNSIYQDKLFINKWENDEI